MKIIGKYLYLFIHLNIERYWKMYLVSKVVPFVGDLEGADQTKGLHSKQTQTHLIIDFVTNQQKPNTKNNRMRYNKNKKSSFTHELFSFHPL